METIKIIKQDYLGRAVWEYPGTVIQMHANRILIEAYFDREDTPVDKLVLNEGDQFIETYFFDQWYNVYEIRDQQKGALKAWYCNISYPANIASKTLTYRDLALDLLVYPDGSQKILDVDEFNGLPLEDGIREKALQALESLKKAFSSSGDFPFSNG